MNQQRQKKIEWIVLVLLTVIAAVCFLSNDLDLWAAKSFYHPENLQDPWFEQNQPLWLFFYHGAPWLTGVLLLGSLWVLVGALFKEKLKKFRLQAVYILLVILLGSGFFINAVFKPYWGRPRPREVIELGGQHPYRHFYLPDFGAQGKSFPCGHCSVGFSYGLFYWVFKRRRPKLAVLSLLGSLFFGAMMGVGRIAAGGHFFSDVVFAGLIVYWSCYWLYYKGLKIPQREEQKELGKDSGQLKIFTLLENKSPASLAIYSVLGVLILMILLMASPFNKPVSLEVKDSSIQKIVLKIDQATVKIVLAEEQVELLKLSGEAKGFGFPGNKVKSECESLQNEVQCRVFKKGFFSDYESSLIVSINPLKIKELRIDLKKGEFINLEQGKFPEYFQFNENAKY